MYNWGEYIDPDLLKQFENETGIKVTYETFDSNEGMMGKIEQGGTSYDISMPSEYMIEMMQEADLILPLDYTQIPNVKNIDPYFLDLPFDPDNNYSLPYFWGTVGIAFNPHCWMVRLLKVGMTYGPFPQTTGYSCRQRT